MKLSQGHHPTPPRPGFWSLLALITIYGLGTGGILWLGLCWLSALADLWRKF